ncbi:uncharacterized protein LOC131680817 [Topomyia yanbarensis]|uniref:uncharacterized protein LOC131680817 n=1 Tax=Topomyia yanbarensis TaxID=2498891 RepID=UPI00273A8C37|nr:uncharacterized protein LOC131680817 [Topomyia yanbarensis]
MAMRRLKHLEQKLAKSPKLYENVCKQVQEYQMKGYAHLASEDELSGSDNPKVWYLPLNVVLHPRKLEKVRLVWDAAATVKGVSLNSQLLTGPDMLVPLTTVINRFRERRIAFGADIREIYHQIRIRDLNPPDIDVTYTRPTKRLVLSCVMGFFDPQGLLAPFTIHGRMLVQDLWRTGCQWDDEIYDSSFAKWKRWTSLLPEVNAIRIPRCYFNCVSADGQIELHIFTDASEFAYGCVAYFRTIINGKVQCSLVMSRSKVAPLKRQSIPRLELMAAVLGARAMHSIQSSHSFLIQRRFLWTDSSTVLSWIRPEQHNYKQLTAFRIGEIVELTSVSDWRWVETKFNIADVLTKWGKGRPLQSDGPWFQGSELMYQLEQDWPRQVLPAPGTKEEMRAFSLFHDVNVPERLMNVQNISRWLK